MLEAPQDAVHLGKVSPPHQLLSLSWPLLRNFQYTVDECHSGSCLGMPPKFCREHAASCTTWKLPPGAFPSQ